LVGALGTISTVVVLLGGVALTGVALEFWPWGAIVFLGGVAVLSATAGCVCSFGSLRERKFISC